MLIAMCCKVHIWIHSLKDMKQATEIHSQVQVMGMFTDE